MQIVTEPGADYVSLQFTHIELVGISNSILCALMFHRSELHTLTALTPEEAQDLIDELKPIIDRMREERLRKGLPW
jgi:hypothetical protein